LPETLAIRNFSWVEIYNQPYRLGLDIQVREVRDSECFLDSKLALSKRYRRNGEYMKPQIKTKES